MSHLRQFGLYDAITIWEDTLSPKPSFDPATDIPDLTGRVIIVTGANTGIGKAIVKALLKKNAKVYMACRSRERAEAAIDDLKKSTGKEAIFLELDLASLGQITEAANEFMSKEKELHVLFNNAGIVSPKSYDDLTKDGFDLTFGVNTLGHAHFTLCLIDLLLEGAKSSPDGKARVVNVASDHVYRHVPALIDYDTLTDGEKRRECSFFWLYNQSKYGNLAFSNELSRRYKDKGIVSTALNPGHIYTEICRNMQFPKGVLWTLFAKVYEPLVKSGPDYGALTPLYAGVSPETANADGKWFRPWAREGTLDPSSLDIVVEQKLWSWMAEQRKKHCEA